MMAKKNNNKKQIKNMASKKPGYGDKKLEGPNQPAD